MEVLALKEVAGMTCERTVVPYEYDPYRQLGIMTSLNALD